MVGGDRFRHREAAINDVAPSLSVGGEPLEPGSGGSDWPGREEYLPFARPDILEHEIDEVAATLRSGWITTGPRVAAFEAEFARYTGANYAVAVSSCTAALHLALVMMGLAPGDEVLVPTLTFAATANAVVLAGGRPVLTDIDRSTMCMDHEDAARRLTSRTRAMVPVHFGGRPCAMENLRALAERHRLRVIEDCAHAVGASQDGAHVGSRGDFGAFSFYATKSLVTGEGGMLVTRQREWADRARRLALHGLSTIAWQRVGPPGDDYDVVEPGFKYNMTDMQAALGLCQLARVDQGLRHRQSIWDEYDRAFADLPVLIPARAPAGMRHARHLYTLLLDLDHLAIGRDDVRLALHQQGIGTSVHFRPLHLHSYYRCLLGHSQGDFPAAEWVAQRTLSLPLSAKLTDREVEDVISALRRTLVRFAVD